MILYGLVAKKNHIIADYSSKKGDFEQIALKLLQKSAKTEAKKSYDQFGYQFTFFNQEDYQFLCMTETET